MPPFLGLFGVIILIFLSNGLLANKDCIPRRDVHELRDCCRLEDPVPRSLEPVCQEKAAAKENPGSMEYGMCLSQCIYEELGVIQGFELNEAKLYALADQYAEADYRAAVKRAAENCVVYVKQNMEHIKNRAGTCIALGKAIEGCMFLGTFDNCPTIRWTSSILCNKYRAGVRMC
ncbi:uncharacterized protein LOC126575409 [Anopheles aquasalis]|uniref:uncharacterized protein LOC126575409 n=1 Tax=Anopheles aquasalis TaxID=42839 RepID=UPI00215B54D1|nr:uncharacterized protein LOC126575409 [Anopheles aquasalis]